jgi:hypothetical protein
MGHPSTRQITFWLCPELVNSGLSYAWMSETRTIITSEITSESLPSPFPRGFSLDPAPRLNPF